LRLAVQAFDSKVGKNLRWQKAKSSTLLFGNLMMSSVSRQREHGSCDPPEGSHFALGLCYPYRCAGANFALISGRWFFGG
jgi:hypothetical protein